MLLYHKKKPIRHEKTKLQATMLVVLLLACVFFVITH